MGCCQVWLVLTPITLTFLAGCGSRPLAEVRVKVVFDGQPVTAGSVVFAPVAAEDEAEAGRSASGAPDANGETYLSTYKKHDGALVGRHKVSYLPPGPPSTIDPTLRNKQLKIYEKYGKCRLPPNHIVEVKPEKNDITLELVREDE